MKIAIKSIGNEKNITQMLEVKPSDSVIDIKKRMKHYTGRFIKEQKLVYNDIEM